MHVGSAETLATQFGALSETHAEVIGALVDALLSPPLPDAEDSENDGLPLAGVVVAPTVQGVVGLALAYAQRERAAFKTNPKEAPLALITHICAAE